MPLAALLPFFSTLAGGLAALRLRHRLHAFMALAAGVVVATAMADLLPEAIGLVGQDQVLLTGIAAVAGFVGFSLVEAFLHQASFEHARDDGASRAAHPGMNDSSPDEGIRRPAWQPRRGNGYLAILPPLSLVLHSGLDGVAIGLAFRASPTVGLIVLLAVLAHDFADGMNVVTLALEATRGERAALVLLILDAIAPPAGAALSLLFTIPPDVLGILLASIAGIFIAVGAGHLLPESQHHDPRQGPALVALSGLGGAIVLVIRGIAG